MCVFIDRFGCVGSPLLHKGFLYSCSKWEFPFFVVLQLLNGVASLVEPELQGIGFSSCGAWAQLWYVGSSWTRDQTCVPCIGRQILNHWTTKEVPTMFLALEFHSLLDSVLQVLYTLFLILQNRYSYSHFTNEDTKFQEVQISDKNESGIQSPRFFGYNSQLIFAE